MPEEQTRLEEMIQRETQLKIQRYHRLNQLAQKGKIVLTGSSLMEQFPIHELLQDLGENITLYNRGFSGFTTRQFQEVLDVAVYELQPSHVFINIGTNDMNTSDYTLEGLLERYEAILRGIQENVPGVKLTLLAYYPLCEELMGQEPHNKALLAWRNNRAVQQANQGVKALAEKLGLAFIDCNKGLVDEQGFLKQEYTVEGIHMFANGYAQVLKELLPHLKEAAR